MTGGYIILRKVTKQRALILKTLIAKIKIQMLYYLILNVNHDSQRTVICKCAVPIPLIRRLPFIDISHIYRRHVEVMNFMEDIPRSNQKTD